MKTSITFFILIFAVCANVFGQITLTRENNTPRAEYRYLYDLVSFDYIEFRYSGVDTIWDFSEMDIYSDTLSYYYTRDSTYISFPGHEHCPEEYPPDPLDTNILRSDNAIYMVTDSHFYQNYNVHEIPVSPGICISTANINILDFPFTYGNEWTDEHAWHDLNWNAHTTVTTQKSDAYGTLILPDTTYTDVLRLYTDYYYHIGYISAHHVYWQKKFIYEWYHEDFQLPLLKLEFMESLKVSYDSPTWTWDTTAWLFSHKTYVPLIAEVNHFEKSLLHRIDIYPCPANNLIRISPGQDIRSIVLYDLSGHRTAAILNEESYQINVSFLHSGFYILKGQFDDGRFFSQKVIIVK